MMKKTIIPIICLLFSLCSFSQICNYRSTSYSFKYVKENGEWAKWKKWKKSDIKLVLDFDSGIITIHSKTPQIYHIIGCLGETKEDNGDSQLNFHVTDIDGFHANIIIKHEVSSGDYKLFVEYSDAMWGYKIKPVLVGPN